MTIEYRNTQYNKRTGHPPVYVINMRGSEERRRSIESQLTREKISYGFVDAVDGVKLGEEVTDNYNEIKRQYASYASSERDTLVRLHHFVVPKNPKRIKVEKAMLLRSLTAGEVGCFLSHMKIYNHMINENNPFAVILEDDAQLVPGFGELILRLAKQGFKYELIFLGHLYWGTRSLKDEETPLSLRGRMKLNHTYELGHFVVMPLGSHGYLITLTGVKKLLELSMPMRLPLDLLLTLGVYDKRYGIAGVNPKVVQTKAYFFQNSTITGRPVGYQRSAGKEWLNGKLPFLYNGVRRSYRFLLGIGLYVRQMGEGYAP